MRNFGSSLGLAVLGSVLILENRSNLEATADKHGLPKQVGKRNRRRDQPGHRRRRIARTPARPDVQKVVDAIPHDFALASRTVFYGMAAVMAVAFVIALVAMPSGKVETEVEDFGEPTSAGPA